MFFHRTFKRTFKQFAYQAPFRTPKLQFFMIQSNPNLNPFKLSMAMRAKA